MTHLFLALALMASIVTMGCSPIDIDGNDIPTCDVGRFVATSIAFEASGCLDAVARDNTSLSATAPGLSWLVSGLADSISAGVVLNDSNSSTTARYEREGLEWVALTGVIGGAGQGESTLALDAVDNATWRGRIEGVAVPSSNNDSLDSVFVTIVAE